MTAFIVLNTCPDETVADRVATTLVEERLAACVNRIPGLRSTYRWEGAVQTDDEVLLLIKTTRAAWPALRERLTALHPYELPEILAVPVDDGLPGYLEWIAGNSAAPAAADK